MTLAKMIEMNSRDLTDFEYFYVFRIKPPWPVMNQHGELLRVLNTHEVIGDVRGQPIDVENSDLKISGRALTASEMLEIVELWNLPDGLDQDRCHIPRHGIATVQDGKFDWLAAICFQCSNISIDGVSATNGGRIISSEHGGMNHDQAFATLLEGLHPRIF